MNYSELIAVKVLNGSELSLEEASVLLKEPINELIAGAGLIKKRNLKNTANLCTILNAKSGRCPEDCRYCAQSAHHDTGIDEYPLLAQEEILAAAKANEANGADYFSIVTSGRRLDQKDFLQIVESVKEIKRTTKLKVCVSLGLLSAEEFRILKDAGVSYCHHNLQTGEEYFAEVITTHSFADKVRTIRNAMEAGLQVCSGGIIGLGESMDDRISMAFKLRELKVRNIPINILVPIKGTPLENAAPVPLEEILRTIALIRYINPKANLIYGAGRKILGEDEVKGYLAGISSVITGDCLTTTGSSVKRDKELMEKARNMNL